MDQDIRWQQRFQNYEYEGHTDITGSRSATRQAFNTGLITQGQKWMDMIESRNRTVHTYREEILKEEYGLIVREYFPLFVLFQEKMQQLS